MTTIDEEIKLIEEKIKSNQNYILSLQQIKEKQKKLNENFPEIIKALKILIPKHGKTLCSDENPINDGKCDRCTILTNESCGMQIMK